MRDHASEKPPDLLKLADAVHTVEDITGERVHVATLHRWATHGLAGCRLRTIYARGSRRTRHQWLMDFFRQVADAKASGCDPRASPPT